MGYYLDYMDVIKELNKSYRMIYEMGLLKYGPSSYKFWSKRKDMQEYKHLDVDVIRKTLEEIWNKKGDKYPIGTRKIKDNLYSISTGQSIIYTTKAGVEEFNKALKENFENEKKKDEDREAS